jgi:hypothetical protein
VLAGALLQSVQKQDAAMKRREFITLFGGAVVAATSIFPLRGLHRQDFPGRESRRFAGRATNEI